MAIYHFSLKVISRNKGQSAIASSAYRAGEKLKEEETGEIKDFSNKKGIVHSEIQLPPQAPREFLDRQSLWNAVQKKEKKSNARLAREVEVAIPQELNRETQVKLVHDYVQQNFVDKGMCADWSIHDKDDGNPHAHIMLTTRSITNKGKWAPKQKSVYLTDKSGNKIPQIDPETGQQKIGARNRKMWKRKTVNYNDWNNKENAVKWRANWANSCNKYLEPDQHIDHRSYRDQKKEQLPTIHEGYVAKQMGSRSERVQRNQEIKKANETTLEIKQELAQLKQYIRMIVQRIQEVINERIRTAKRPNSISGTTRRIEQAERTISKSNTAAAIRQRETQRRESAIKQQDSGFKQRGSSNPGESKTSATERTIDYANLYNKKKGPRR